MSQSYLQNFKLLKETLEPKAHSKRRASSSILNEERELGSCGVFLHLVAWKPMVKKWKIRNELEIRFGGVQRSCRIVELEEVSVIAKSKATGFENKYKNFESKVLPEQENWCRSVNGIGNELGNGRHCFWWAQVWGGCKVGSWPVRRILE